MTSPQKEQHDAKKAELMEKCFACYAENGLTGTGMKALAQACGCTPGNLYLYFDDLDDLIVQSTVHCMAKVEDEFMEKAPTDPKDIARFLQEVPYWTAKEHGKKYRLMYQVYTHPKYIEQGKKFFEGVNERYTAYAKRLEDAIGIPYTVITPPDLYLCPRLRPLRHVRGRILPASPDGNPETGRHPVYRAIPGKRELSFSGKNFFRFPNLFPFFCTYR